MILSSETLPLLFPADYDMSLFVFGHLIYDPFSGFSHVAPLVVYVAFSGTDMIKKQIGVALLTLSPSREASCFKQPSYTSLRQYIVFGSAKMHLITIATEKKTATRPKKTAI